MAETKRDYYEVLGVAKDADDSAIKSAYRKLAKKYHPDANPGDKEAEAKFKEASEAYAILSDPEKRKQYDQFGHAAFDPSMGGSGGFDFNSFNASDIFGDLFGDFFGGFGSGGRTRSSNGAMRGANLRARVHISFEEAVTGVKKEIEITLKDECKQCHGTGAKPGTSPETCSRCGGSGQEVFTQQSLFGAMRSVRPCSVCGGSGKIIRDKCPDCQGTGYVRNRQRISIDIPAGIDDGQSIRLRGKGDPGVNGGERGDLLVEVSVAQHPLFKRQDTDIFSTVPISFAQAALGGPIRIRTVDGEVEFQVKQGTQTDTRIRLRGKGMPSLNSRGTRGDHYVTLVVQVPTRLTSEQADALRAFDEAMNGGSRNDGSGKGRKKKIFG